MAELQATLSEKEAEILRLKEELMASSAKRGDTVTLVSLTPGSFKPLRLENVLWILDLVWSEFMFCV